jgi:acyl-CoA reductase-like NAD-dependent aldehyde dehydrogenase
MAVTEQTTIVPHTQQPLVTRVYPSESELDDAIERSGKAQTAWNAVPLDERIAIGRKFIVS